MPLEDQRRLFDASHWGTAHGSLAAAAYLREVRRRNLSAAGFRRTIVLPLQSAHTAIKGSTDPLRRKLGHRVEPAGLEPPLVTHAKSFLVVEPLPPPLYDPALAADAILFAAEHPRRDLFVGGAAKMFSAAAYHTPHIFVHFTSRFMGRAWQGRHPAGRSHRHRVALQSCRYTKSTGHRHWPSTLLRLGMVSA
ncbi:hypothetical protein [Cupriavidus sp. CuC1]|uniref:hypothetical protein n=1 Tax=Cupriavidus sp. CuC1 TaxID=3373131 RepID=UPI0037D86C3E